MQLNRTYNTFIAPFVLLILTFIIRCDRISAQLNPQPNVDLFTGAFECAIPLLTIPGPHGSGYTVVLNYSSDVTAEAEASWVGYGWSLEPPNIVRQLRGLPDDMQNRMITFINKGSISSESVTLFGSGEIIATPAPTGADDSFKGSLGIGGSLTLTWNTLTGFDITMSGGLSGAIGMKTPPIGIGTGLSFDSKKRFGISMGAGIEGWGGGPSFGLGTSLFTYNPSAVNRPMPALMMPFSGKSFVGELSGRIAGYEGGLGYASMTLNLDTRSYTASGFLYSHETVSSADNSYVMVDYLVDRDRPVDALKASPLPMPLQAYDEFYVSSPNVSGRFRAHHWLPMYARPPKQISRISLSSISLKGVIPAPSVGGGVGANIPYNRFHTTTTEGNPSAAGSGIAKEISEWSKRMHPFFRFIGDPADPLLYSPKPLGEPLPISLYDIPKWAYTPVNEGIKPKMNRSVEYKTVRDIREMMELTSDLSFKSWLKSRLSGYLATPNLFLGGVSAPTKVLPDEAICEFSVTNEDGVTTEFGAPEYRTEESVEYVSAKGSGVTTGRNADRVFFTSKPIQLSSVQNGSGREVRHTYASQWNATAIYEPNYIDVNGNGPDNVDVGGWTVFRYSDDIERRWRTPYCGYLLDRRLPHKPDDDIFAYAKGKYKPRYLRSIETATHIAFFFTNQSPNLTADEDPNGTETSTYSYLERVDAFEPSDGDDVAHSPEARTGKNTVPYLARIELWVKGADGKPKTKLRTIHLSYDYSVCPGNPSSGAVPPLATSAGKLTLRRLWAEDRDVKDPKIEPLDFFYRYPAFSGMPGEGQDGVSLGTLFDRYPNLTIPSGLNENPAFSANDINAWGYQSGVAPALSGDPNDEPQRYAPKQKWDSPNVDPGSWRLKTIRMSSNARIIPIYEDRTYRWVQDRDAMTLVSLDADLSNDLSSTNLTTSPNDGYYYINLQKTGIDPANASQVEHYVTNFKNQFLTGGEPIYIRYGYDVSQCEPGIHYVRGYAKVSACDLTVVNGTQYMKIKLGESQVCQPLGQTSFFNLMNQCGQKTTPFGVVLKYWKSFLRNKCESSIGDPINAVSRIVGLVGNSQGDRWKISDGDVIPISVLPRINLAHSVIRIPVAGVKIGGGARVKTLLNISPDGALEEGDVSALGTEYIYGEQDDDGNEILSYGACTDEPFLMREQNANVCISKDKWSEANSKVLDEEDMATIEEPLGAMLLPSPSIGYSQVITRSINHEVTTPGYVVSKFLTVHEIPTLEIKTGPASVNPDFYDNPNDLLFQKSELRLGISQSYGIKLYEYHGLPSSVESYSGTDKDNRILVSSMHYDYLLPNDSKLIFYDQYASLRVRKPVDLMDIIHETRRISEDMDVNRIDISAEVVGVVPIIGLGFKKTTIDHIVETSVSSSISRYNPLLWRTISTQDGKADTSEILAWDSKTGFPAISTSHDEYHSKQTVSNPASFHDGTIATVSLPALKIYPELGQRSSSYRMKFGNQWLFDNPGIGPTSAIMGATGEIHLTRTDPDNPNSTLDRCQRYQLLFEVFSEGDIIQIRNFNDELQAVARVVNVTMPSCSTEVVITCESIHGTLPEASAAIEVEIVESGRRNLISGVAWKTTLYGENFESARDRAAGLQKLEDWLYFFNVGARSGYSQMNFKDFEDPYNGRFPLKFDKGGSDILNPNQSQVNAAEDYPGRFQPNCMECRSNPNNLSQYWYMNHRQVQAGNDRLRVGIQRPVQAVEYFPFNPGDPPDIVDLTLDPANNYQCSKCAAFMQYWTLSPGTTAECTYHWLWIPGVGYADQMPCYKMSWLSFSGTIQNWPVGFAVDDYEWDEWRRFYVTDMGKLVVGSIQPSQTAANSGGLQFIGGNFSVEPVLPSNTTALSTVLMPWSSKDFVISGKTVRQWFPTASWHWESDATVNASGAAGDPSTGVHEKSGGFMIPTIPSANDAKWTDAVSEPSTPSNLNPRIGWFRSSVAVDVNTHAEPTELETPVGTGTTIQFDAAGIRSRGRFC